MVQDSTTGSQVVQDNSRFRTVRKTVGLYRTTHGAGQYGQYDSIVGLYRAIQGSGKYDR